MDPLTKKPPQNIEAEACVIGSILLDNDVVGLVAELLSPPDFYDPAHRTIYEAAIALFDENRSIDAVTIKDRLMSTGRLDEVGGVEALVRVIESVPSAAHAVDYAKIVRDRAIKRRLIAIADKTTRAAFASEEPAERLIEEIESEVFQIAEGRGGDEPSPMGKVLQSTVKMVEDLHKQKGRISGCGTNFFELDDKTNGFQPGDFIVLAARPSVGKTTFALNCALNMALYHKKSVAFFSLEMAREQIVANMLCSVSRVKSTHLRRGNLSESEWSRIVDAAGVLHDAPIFVDDTPGLSPTSLRGKARRLKRRHGIDCIMIDYLQLMDAAHVDNRQQEISLISRSLKGIARELRVPVIALSQINRAAEKEERKPRMSDLRESGAIEQDADVCLFLWRPDYQKTDQPEPPAGEGRKTELIIAKQRNGPTGMVELLFFPEIMKFENPARGYAAAGAPG
jgi:replicative DNA helicase